MTAREFRFYTRWENSETPSIVRETGLGGDPRIVARFSRVYDEAALYELCELANRALRDDIPSGRAGR